MEKKKQTILVPTDFSEVGGYALEHAVKIAKTMDNNISLLHIAKEQKDIPMAEKKCQEIADEAFTRFFLKPGVIVKVGTIFSTIGEVADEIEANLVIMGTHGIKGMQKLTGSWALKVLVGSKVPFVIVQDPPKRSSFERVVFPLDFRREDKEKNSWVSYLSKYYKSKFFIIKESFKDKSFKARVTNNVMFTKKFLDSKQVEYEIVAAPGKKKFHAEVISYAMEVNADLILVMTTRDISLADYALGAAEQKIIANSAHIPVMCVNPHAELHLSGGFSAMGG
jgi:nucleotide-binding universal stress UspA family protein